MEIEKKYYTIGEVADILEVSTSLVRFWESQFDIVKPKKSKNGVRHYTKQDIESLKTIYHLVKEKGYTLSGAKALLTQKTPVRDVLTVIESLEKMKEFLVNMKLMLDNKDTETQS